MDFWGYRNATTLVEMCVFLSLLLFEGKNLKIDAFVEMHMYEFLENATVKFLFLLEILLFYRVRKHIPFTIMPRFLLVYVNQIIVRSETFSISIFSNDYYFYLR